MLTRTFALEIERATKDGKPQKRFPASISSDVPISRRTWDGDWTEILSHAKGAVDLARAPLPLIEGHDRSRTNIGIVEGLRVDGGKLRGELVLGSSARAVELAQDIADGIVRSLSIGAEILEEKRDEKAKRVTVTRWRPLEVSIVSTPADVTVGIGRSAARSTHMDEQTTTTTPAPDATRAAAPAPEALAERERITEISALATRHALGDAFSRDLIARGVTLEQARGLILERLAARDEANPIASHLSAGELFGRGESRRSAITPGNDYAEDFRRATVDALLLRAGIRVEKPHAAAGDVSASVYDIARTCLSRSGKSASRWFGGEARGPELLKRAATTSDFPAILEGALHATIRKGWEDEPSSHRAWVRVVPFADFREAKRPILSSAPDLDKLGEHAEYRHGYFSDEGTGYSISKFGKIVALSWESLLADNLGAFFRVQGALGAAARRLEADLTYGLFALNSGAGPAMPDTKALFHADHANLTSSGAFDAALLGAGRTLLRKQKSLAAVGSTGGYLSLVPKFLIVPAERETAAEVLLANASRRVTAEKATGEWIANLELVVEPRLANTAAFLAADPAQIDTIELGLLEENVAGPHIETEQGFGTDESRWKIRHTAGVKALDHRGMVKMPISP
ncbi:phage major capsid protein [Anaeromyxobacter terrae]|uniref:phage major capsid protein n=1 Tax=Anaeromyxobacter terrae TaxID=2925406 RepID=UPI001F56DAA2|nr:HK97 family phage prohead protease [Anaeromyxobacter sp. SG22]